MKYRLKQTFQIPLIVNNLKLFDCISCLSIVVAKRRLTPLNKATSSVRCKHFECTFLDYFVNEFNSTCTIANVLCIELSDLRMATTNTTGSSRDTSNGRVTLVIECLFLVLLLLTVAERLARQLRMFFDTYLISILFNPFRTGHRGRK